jgi:hypothetical protein
MTTDQLDAALDSLLDRCENAYGDWPDVLRRARIDRVVRARRTEPRRRSRWHRRSTVVATAVVVAAIVVATALATGLGQRFSAWIGGTPGRPAPAGLQHGFDVRNSAAYAGFPAGTKLRLLSSRTVKGTTFSLLGFRNHDTYCLRLVRTDHPNGIGRNECLRAEELADVPALVAGDAWFTVGKPAVTVNGVYGFAADGVRRVQIGRLRGGETVPVINNVFLSLTGVRAGTVQNHPLPNPVLTVHALMRDGQAQNVPYASGFMSGLVPNGVRPSVPSYFRRPSRQRVPGPTRIEAPIAHPTISWLKHHEPRGKPLPTTAGHPAFGRVIQPDPDDPIETGIAVGARGALCDYFFQPLATQTGGRGCGPWFADGPIRLGNWTSEPISHFDGFVADGVAHVTFFLASGRILQAALRDNVFAVAFPQAELPGEVVAYDAKNRVAGITQLPGNGVLAPCPLPAFTTPVAKLPAPRPWERLDLGTLSVNGKQILGMSPGQVIAALGRPAVSRPRDRTFRYGGTLPSTLGLQVSFGKKGSRIFARSLYFQSPSLVDTKLGHLLRLDPARLEREIAHTYGSAYRVYLDYGSNPQLGCSAELKRGSGPRGLDLGLDPYRPSRPYLVISSLA